MLDRGHELNPDTDRLFVLASRGATLDADAAINGRGIQPAQHFSVGKTYRLRFTHISLDDVKNVRLLLNGKPVMWRPFAKDGATLPARESRRDRSEAADGRRRDVRFRMDAGGTRRVCARSGDGLLSGARHDGAAADCVRRGPVTEAALRVAATGTSLAVGDPLSTALPKLAGAYVSSTTAPSPDVVSVWSDSTGLAVSRTVAGVESPAHCLIPLADGSFVPGTCENGFMKEAVPVEHFRFDGSERRDGDGRERARSFQRVAALKMSDAALARFVGHYEFGFATELRGGVLTMTNSGRPGEPPGRDLTVGTPLTALSPSRFIGTARPVRVACWNSRSRMIKSWRCHRSTPTFGFTAKRVDREP